MHIGENSILAERYRITKLLGQGGMGAVYLASDMRFRASPVAVKRTLVGHENEELRRAFEREAMLLYHLRHPALPRVIDYFGEGDSQFLVMEFVPGEDFGSILARRPGPCPIEQVAVWSEKLLDVLTYLHTRTPPVIHRDIKPQNLKLTPTGEIILLDFGLAKGSVGPGSHTATASASVHAATRFFAPPEQLSGLGTDERSDLYSFGATLYALLTETAPVDAAVRSSSIINGEEDPLRSVHNVNPRVPPSVSAVIRQAMRLRKDERYASAAAMRDALREALATTEPMPGVEEASDEASMSTLWAESTVAALGGDAFVRMRSMVIVGSGTIASAGGQWFEVPRRAIWAAPPDKNRVEYDFGDHTSTYVAAGDHGWKSKGTGEPVEEVAPMREALVYGLEVLRRLALRGASTRALEGARVGGTRVNVFAVSGSDGEETTFSVDARTSLPVKFGYMLGDELYEVLLADYRRVSGVSVPCAVQYYCDGEKYCDMTYADVRVNVELEPGMFARP